MAAHATLNGTITATGGENADTRGFDYGYVSGSYASTWTEAGAFGIGSFAHVISGLENSRKVYFRAKAHNSGGWGYGTEQSFMASAPSTIRRVFRKILPREVLEVIIQYVEVKVSR